VTATAAETPTTAHDVEVMLRRHYLPEGRPPGGLFAPEIMSPDGKRRADVMWLETTTVGRGTLHGHEIKVSRADVMNELADPTKMDAWARYCDYWWLVVSDPALVTGLDVPEHWGIMSPPSGRRTRSMTVERKATRLHPIDKTEAMTRLLIWRHYKADEQIARLQHDLRYRTEGEQRAQEELTRLRNSIPHSADRPNPVAERIRRILGAYEKRLSKATHAEGMWRMHRAEPTEEAIADALIDLVLVERATEDARTALDRTLADLTAIADPLRNAREIVDRARVGLGPSTDPGH
jgi:hypothetical protein